MIRMIASGSEVFLQTLGAKMADAGQGVGQGYGASGEPFQVSGIMELLEETAERPHGSIEDVVVNGQHQRDLLLMEEESIIRAGVDDPSPIPAQDCWQQEGNKRKPGRIINHAIARKTTLEHLVEHMGAVARGHGTDDAVNQRFWSLSHEGQPLTYLVQQGESQW